jgi:hypothetical protein
MGQLIFQDVGAFILFFIFIAVHLIASASMRDRLGKPTYINVAFSIILIFYVIWRSYGN